MNEPKRKLSRRGAVAEAMLDEALSKPSLRPGELDFRDLAGPRREGETLEAFAARYQKMNDQLEDKYGGEPRIDDNTIGGKHVIQCSVCNTAGPMGTTLSAAARLAQQQGFVHLRDDKGHSVRGGPHNFLVWVCKEHAEADRKAKEATRALLTR